MNNDEKILKALEALQADVSEVKQGQAQITKRLSNLEDGQAHLKTAIEAVKAGQDDIREKVDKLPTIKDVNVEVETAKAEIKADILMLNSSLASKVHRHEKRIGHIEEKTGINDPTKN